MTERFCPECGDDWKGAYNTDDQCTTCGARTLVRTAGPLLRFMPVGQHDFDLPEMATDGSAAYDLRATATVTLWPGDEALVGTGWAIEPPPGTAAFLLPRSGLGAEEGIVLGNLVGLIDPDYRGEVMVKLWHRRAAGSGKARVIERGERIAQLVLLPFVRARSVEVESLSLTQRGSKGFGDSGRF